MSWQRQPSLSEYDLLHMRPSFVCLWSCLYSSGQPVLGSMTEAARLEVVKADPCWPDVIMEAKRRVTLEQVR